MELNSVFCERELYDGTAPEQKAENAQKRLKFDVSAAFKFVAAIKFFACLFLCFVGKVFYKFLCVWFRPLYRHSKIRAPARFSLSIQ